MNALDTVVIPRIGNTVHAQVATKAALPSPSSPSHPHPHFQVEYIKSELDELEREEFFRLKRSQDKKKALIAEAAAAKKAEAEKLAAAATAAYAALGAGMMANAGGADADVVY